MKKMKKLFPALCLLLVSATLLGTSTYAWFSMNKEVSTDNMSITAKADTTYLLIGSENNISAIRTGAKTVETTKKSGTLFPAALATETTNPSADTTAANWYYAEGETSSNGTEKTGTKVVFSEDKRSEKNNTELTIVDSDTFNTRVLKKTVYIALAQGSEKATNLKANLIGITDSIPGTPTRVVVATGTNVEKFDTVRDGEVTLISEIKGDEIVQVDIYVYYDGSVAEIKSDNISNIVNKTATDVEIKFVVD